ncbi:protein O-mannosyltransferase [Gordonia effusa NBRC 100432]|uniref:Polyprenol-phosphate-mannose--protein mannosyltransferase n=1 Tax=Gordonia effusa NBRC 100432 TaxID=1077974 RepID=H0QUQ9_9ACTN|nr:protein O-mannosyltransferase [Gordonia effusa NBRC 100432]
MTSAVLDANSTAPGSSTSGSTGTSADLGNRPGRAIPRPIFGPTDRFRGRCVGIAILVLATVTRFWSLVYPTDQGTPVFDEKHYVPQGWQVLTGGNWIEDNPAYGLVVHPPVGKWMLAIGESVFGYTPLGWRIMPALCGIGIVMMIYVVVRRMSRSTLIGALAGIFAICDGVLVVQSRLGMLDIFQAFFMLAAFTALIADRDQMRERMHKVYLEGRINDSQFGPRLGFRWWRFTAGVMLGLTCGTKWSGIYFVIFFVILALGFDVAARRAYQVRRPWVGTLVRDVVPSGLSLAVMPVVIYLVSFVPWFNSETSVYRYQVGNTVGLDGPWSWIPAAWRSLWYYESSILNFHEGLTNSAGNHHPWESKPWTWPMGLRPMLYAIETGPDKCGNGDCIRAQMLVGTPAMWWLALPMLAWALWAMIMRRDWRYAAVLVGYGAAFLPWFANLDRQMYFFYATAMAPFLMMGLALCCGDILSATARTASRRPERHILAILVVCLYTGLVIANFLWLWPILTGAPISQETWRLQIWLPSWG